MQHPENSEDFAGLTVNSGVSQPPIVNPYLRKRKRQALPSPGEMVEGILKGDVTMLSRAVTLVESLVPAHQTLAQEVIEIKLSVLKWESAPSSSHIRYMLQVTILEQNLHNLL